MIYVEEREEYSKHGLDKMKMIKEYKGLIVPLIQYCNVTIMEII